MQEGYERSKALPQLQATPPKASVSTMDRGSNVQTDEPMGVASYSDCLRGAGGADPGARAEAMAGWQIWTDMWRLGGRLSLPCMAAWL